MGISDNPVDFEFFEFYGLPVAGRLFSRDRPLDALPTDDTVPNLASIVINETAARRFGFADPLEAIGTTISFDNYRDEPMLAEIIGVVADFSVDSIHTAVRPNLYILDEDRFNMLSVRLSGLDPVSTLESIDRLWNETGAASPVSRTFLDQHIRDLQRDVSQQGILFAGFSSVALFIACIGLLGLSTNTADRRTKEIGIRKVTGASAGNIITLLLWQFSKPILWASLIAWPIAYFVVRGWLNGFAYHIDLTPWFFFAASALTLVIALATVFVHTYLAARAKPVTALRYE